MRLFVAIDIPHTLKTHIASSYKTLGKHPELRLVQPDALHLTLNFLGEHSSATEIIEKLRTIEFEKFSITTANHVELLPPHQRPRVLWIPLEESTELNKLQRNIDVLFTPQESYKPHLTLARVKRTSRENIKKIVHDTHLLRLQPTTFEVNTFKLYRSTLTPLGPIYEVLETCKAR